MATIVQDAKPGKFSRLSPAIASALLATAVFAVTLGGTYIYDDFDVFQLDPRLHNPSAWGQYWTQSYNGGVDNLYRPLVSMSYAVQWWLHGADESDAWKFHLVNLLLHAAVAAVVAELARRLSGLRLAWIAGLLFAAHPVHVEAVANIVGRAELMCALGVVGALVLFLHEPMTTGRAFAITGCFVMAVLSKEQGMLAPLLILLLCLSLWERRPERRASLVLIILLTWSLAAYIVFRESILKFWWDRNFLDWTINPLVRPDADRWLMPFVLLGHYVILLVFPWKLSPDYGAKVIGWTIRLADPYLWIGIAAVVVWSIWLIIALVRRSRVAIFALLALAVTYGLVSNFIMLIGTNFAERLMYLPSVFFMLLVGLSLQTLPRKVLVPALTVLLILACARSVTYARRWNDRLSFYQTSLREQPRSIRLDILVAFEQMSRGDIDAAETTAEHAANKLPEYWETWVLRYKVALERGDFDAAGRYLDIAAKTPRAPLGRIVGFMNELAAQRARAGR